jgi:cellulose synthase/poly-beta-1,6-N-acetylglucosamine synthase-like glycosyltransferase
MAGDRWLHVAAYVLIAAMLHGALLTLIVMRRDRSGFDYFVFVYCVFHLLVDGLRLLAGIVKLLRLGAPRLADLREGEWPPLTVVIPCHNEEEVIEDTLRSLSAVDYPDLRIIVVDDGSTDQTAALAAASLPPPLVLRQRASGKAGALNAGIAEVQTPLTLLVDADCLFPREGLRDAVRHLLGEGEDALGGHLAVANRDTWITRLQHLEYGDIALRHLLWPLELNLSHTQDVIPGALGLFRTSALRAAGPLSTTHLAEDVALTARLVEQGRRLAFSPYLQASTVVPDALSTLRIQRRRWVRGYTQVAAQQLRRLPQIPVRARIAALAMALKTVRWPFDFALSLVYGLNAWSDGQPEVLLLSLVAMLFPFTLSGLHNVLRTNLQTVAVMAYGYGMLLLGWRVWDQLTLLVTPHPRWEPYDAGKVDRTSRRSAWAPREGESSGPPVPPAKPRPPGGPAVGCGRSWPCARSRRSPPGLPEG